MYGFLCLMQLKVGSRLHFSFFFSFGCKNSKWRKNEKKNKVNNDHRKQENEEAESKQPQKMIRKFPPNCIKKCLK